MPLTLKPNRRELQKSAVINEISESYSSATGGGHTPYKESRTPSKRQSKGATMTLSTNLNTDTNRFLRKSNSNMHMVIRDKDSSPNQTGSNTIRYNTLGSEDDPLPEKKHVNFGSSFTPEDDDLIAFGSNMEKNTDKFTMGIARRAAQVAGKVMMIGGSSKRRQELKDLGDEKNGGVMGMLGQWITGAGLDQSAMETD